MPSAPAGVTDLVRWYAADQLALAHGDQVATWPDLSGNSADLTAPGAAPVFLTGRWNRLPGVLFPGTGTSRKLSSAATANRPSSDVTVFAVVANFKRGTSPQFVAWGSGATNGFNLFGSSSTDANGQPPAFILLRGSGTWANNEAIMATPYPSRGDPVILTGIADGATTKIRVDGGNEVTDTGDSGSISYGGSVELSIGDKGSGAGIFQGIVYEVLIYSRALNSTEVAEIEAYLDGKWRVTIKTAQFFASYDGAPDAGGTYGVGLAWSPDGLRFKRYFANPVIATGSGWKSSTVKDPYTLWDGTQWVMYYAGQNGTNYQIGRATSPDHVTWTDYASNPVVGLGGSGAIDEAGCAFPIVILDTLETDATRRWKMWYAATAASAPDIFSYTIAYATSPDGLTWTKRGRMLNWGGAGTWDAAAVAPGDVHKDPTSGVYTMLYQGRKNVSAPQSWQGGAATFTDPEGTYTKHVGNPTILNNGASQALTANLTGLTVTVADTSGFAQGDAVLLDRVTEGGSVPDVGRVLTVDSSTQITLEWAPDSSYPTSDSARIVHHWRNSVVARSILPKNDGTFDVFLTPFQPTNDGSHTGFVPIREGSIRANIASLMDTPALTGHLVLGMLGDNGKWDSASSENYRVIPAAPSNQIGVFTLPMTVPVGNAVGPRA